MTTAALDTLRISKRLRHAGFSEAQAETLADVIREGVARSELVTKADLNSALAGIGPNIRAMKDDIIQWMLVAVAVQGALEILLIKLLPGS